MERHVSVAAMCLLALAAPTDAQTYKPTPVARCDTLAALRIGPERGSGASPLPHELLGNIQEALASCEQAVKDRPKEGRFHAYLARLRALAGDAAGAREAARTGAELGSPTAVVILGVMDAEARDYGAARERFRAAAKQRSPHAHFNLGAMESDPTDAAAAFIQAAQGGDSLAMQIVGQRYDKSQAERWFKRAAEAMLTEEPRNPLRIAVEIDSAALIAWYRDKARAEPWAQAYLGLLYEAGQWVRQDYAAAASWYRRAGEAGNVPAQWRLARLYNEGRGVPRDPREARRWGQMHQVARCEEHERAEAGAEACDRLAADRYDPQRSGPGVDSFCMRHFAERAVAACTAAVKRSPATVRYRTQLARALAHTGRFPEARREAGAAAAKGSTTAMILLGVMSQRGLGADADGADALAWYRKAADAGDTRGVSLFFTLAKDSPEAKAMLQALRNRPLPSAPLPSPTAKAESGDPRAQFNLAAQLEREKKHGEALKWYERAAAQGFRPAEMNLAQMYEKGIGVPQDTLEARRRYRRLADLADPEARYRAAKLAADAGDYAEALKYYQRSIRDDDHRAMLDVGEMHERGRGVPRDVRRAAALYERAAERSPWARFKLGVIYLEVLKDYPKALHWMRRSAADGHRGAHNNLGLMYDRGLGVKVDYAAAREHWLSALGGGNDEARGNLESFFASGRGAPSGPAAVEWYQAGADSGVASAQYRLGQIYAKGEGIARDDRVAAQWLLKAAHQGHPEARKQAAELFYAMGDDIQAASLGHEGATRRLADKLEAAGRPEAAARIRHRLAAGPPKFPAAAVYPQGVATDPGDDPQRTMVVRIAGVGTAHTAAADAAMANVYDIIRWFPETDGKAKK